MVVGIPPREKRGLSSRRRFRCRLHADQQLAAVDLYMETISHHTGNKKRAGERITIDYY